MWQALIQSGNLLYCSTVYFTDLQEHVDLLWVAPHLRTVNMPQGFSTSLFWHPPLDLLCDLSHCVHIPYMHVHVHVIAHALNKAFERIRTTCVHDIYANLINHGGNRINHFSDGCDLQLNVLARATEELKPQGNLIRACRMCVLKAKMHLLKLDTRGKRGGVAAVFSSFLCVHAEQEKPYYTLPSGTD